MQNAAVLFLLLVNLSARADDIVKIEPAAEIKKYSHAELQKKVWELEKAVQQLQQKVFALETAKPQVPVVPAASPVTPAAVKADAKWYCKVRVTGSVYQGVDLNKETAIEKSIKNCRSVRGREGFQCRDPDCAQQD